MTRILVTVPHYFRRDAGGDSDGRRHGSSSSTSEVRLQSLHKVITSLHQLYGRPQCMIDIAGKTTHPTNKEIAEGIDVVICTTGDHHLLNQLDLEEGYYQQDQTEALPLLLGYECHRILRERIGAYDFYCYLEDDLVLHDPWFFQKLTWLRAQTSDEIVFLPQRYEVAWNRIVHKAYVDGDIREGVTTAIRDVDFEHSLELQIFGVPVKFEQPRNPHSGCFFLNKHQMSHWASQDYFLDRSSDFVGPLESAATLGVFRAFNICKPTLPFASVLEIEHCGTGFLNHIRSPNQRR